MAAAHSKGETRTRPTGETDTPGRDAGDPVPAARKDPRLYIYAGFDFIMAGLYVLVLFWLIPNRHGWVQALSWLMVLSAGSMGIGMIAQKTWSWWLGVAGCIALMLLAAAFLVLTVLSAAFLAGVYGAFGKAATSLALVGAALVIELVALLPAFQLKFLMTRAGRKSFGKEPLWP